MAKEIFKRVNLKYPVDGVSYTYVNPVSDVFLIVPVDETCCKIFFNLATPIIFRRSLLKVVGEEVCHESKMIHTTRGKSYYLVEGSAEEIKLLFDEE